MSILCVRVKPCAKRHVCAQLQGCVRLSDALGVLVSVRTGCSKEEVLGFHKEHAYPVIPHYIVTDNDRNGNPVRGPLLLSFLPLFCTCFAHLGLVGVVCLTESTDFTTLHTAVL